MKLGCTLGELDALPHDEYVRWRAYLTWLAVQRQHHQDVADMRARRQG